MIRYRKPNRARDVVGAILFAVAAALLWADSSMAKNPANSVDGADGNGASVAVIRSAEGGGSGSL